VPWISDVTTRSTLAEVVVAVYDVVVVDVVVVGLTDFDWVLITEWCMGVWGVVCSCG